MYFKYNVKNDTSQYSGDSILAAILLWVLKAPGGQAWIYARIFVYGSI